MYYELYILVCLLYKSLFSIYIIRTVRSDSVYLLICLLRVVYLNITEINSGYYEKKAVVFHRNTTALAYELVAILSIGSESDNLSDFTDCFGSTFAGFFSTLTGYFFHVFFVGRNIKDTFADRSTECIDIGSQLFL